MFLEFFFQKLENIFNFANIDRNPMHIDMTNAQLREENLFHSHFVPILANYDPLALLTSSSTTTTSPIPYPPPKHDNKNKNRPHSIHQFSFVQHNKPHVHISPRPRPPQIILSSMHQPTQNPVKLFIPSPTYLPRPPLKKQPHNSHRKPFKLDGSSGSWDIKFNISQELRDLLMLERIKLENISQTIGAKSKWVVTSSRIKHIKNEDDVFVARANNPFGHSTKWKLR